MEASKKLISYVKSSISGIGSILSSRKPQASAEVSLEWSNNNDTVVIKRCEYECMQTDLLNQTEMIKRLKRKEEENQSLLQDYEGMFTMVLKKDLSLPRHPAGSAAEGLPRITERYENELAKLRSNEERLKSHIQALKRDLVASEERAENIEDCLEQKMIFLKNENDSLAEALQNERQRCAELEAAGGELRSALEKRCSEMAEVVAYCRYLTN